MNRRGSALLSVVIISLLLFGLVLTYLQWTTSHSKQNTHHRAGERAFEYAESGIEAAQQYIRMPNALNDKSADERMEEMPGGGVAYSLTLDTVSVASGITTNILEIYSTGYFDGSQGSEEDPVTHLRAQSAVIRTKLFFDRVDSMLVAVPGTLRVNPGTVAAGLIYGRDLEFLKGMNQEKVTVAAYSRSIKIDPTNKGDAPYVVFASTPQNLSYPPRLPRLNAATRAYYQQYATTPQSRLSDASSLDGMVPLPSQEDVPVYFCDGDLEVGKVLMVTPENSFIVYVTGNLEIHNSIGPNPAAWVVFLVEKDIRIAQDAPNTLVLTGTFVANGKITSPDEHRGGQLMVTGSLIANGGIDLAASWSGSRQYYFQRADPALPLPRVTEVLDYSIDKGKYQ